MSTIYEIEPWAFKKMLEDKAMPVDFKCPECNRVYRMYIQYLDGLMPVISCDCGYAFNRAKTL